MSEANPYENSLSIEELRREVRRCWDKEHALLRAIRDAAEIPPPFVLSFLSEGATFPSDWNKGKELQRKTSLDAIPPNTECEMGAGLWFRIRHGLITAALSPSREDENGHH